MEKFDNKGKNGERLNVPPRYLCIGHVVTLYIYSEISVLRCNRERPREIDGICDRKGRAETGR
jgi:hypothetical protein